MDAKITKLRLSRMLSYDWLKIVATAAALIFFWVLVFTVSATRVLPSQEFKICNYLGNDVFSNEFTKTLNKAKEDDALSFEVLSVGTEDFAMYEENAYQLLPARISTNELDVIFVSEQSDSSTAIKNEQGEITGYSRTYLQSFVRGYSYTLHNIESYLSDMEVFLNGYYGGDYQNGTLDTAKVETEFRARIKRMKDKRYKKQAEIEAGIQGESERLEKYRDALVKTKDYLEKGIISLTKTTILDEETGEALMENKCYSFNLCPEGSGMEKLSNVVSYSVAAEEENASPVKAAKNMNICLFNLNGKEEAYRYEGLLYVTNLVEQVLAME